MKIFIEPRRLRTENIEDLRQQFPKIDFVNTVDESYDAEIMFVYPDAVNYENINKYPNLKWIQLLTAGFNTSDLRVIKEKKLLFTNAKGVYSKTIAEDVFTKILAINRNVKYYYENMAKHIWESPRNEPEICGSTVGILGMGSIATEIAKRMKAFEAKVIGYRRTYQAEEYFDEVYTQEEGLNELLSQSDYIILALPSNEDSIGLINFERISKMKPTSVLINIARGDIIVQEDLIKALKHKVIRAAGLDVTTPEPLPQDSELWDLDNVFLTPHSSVSSPILYTRLTSLLIDNLNRYLSNEKLVNIVEE